MKNLIRKHKYAMILGIFIFAYILYFTLASFLRYDNFYTGRFDLGNMDQTVWNSIHGKLFQITDPNGTEIISRLAFHADFILVLISPLYLIWSDPKILLLLQTVILSLGAVFVYLISKKITNNLNISLVLSTIFLLNPSVQYSNLYDFHAVTLATTFLLATFYFFLKRKYLLFLVFAILSGLTKENVWLIISIFGLAIMLRAALKNKFRIIFFRKFEFIFGISVFIISAILFYFLIWHAIPNALGSNHFALSYYSEFGDSPTNIARNILLNPVKIVSSSLQDDGTKYLLDLLAPLGFLPVMFSPTLIFAAPDFLIDLLSNNPQLRQIYYQYTTTITPFLFISAIYAAYYIRRKFTKLSFELIAVYLLSMTLISSYLIGPLPTSKSPSIDMFTRPLKNREAISNFIESIPQSYSVAATNNLGSHLSRRQRIFTIPVGIDKADIILFLLNDPSAQPSLEAQKQMAKQMESDKSYEEIYKNGDFIVFEKRGLHTTLKPKEGQVKLFPYSITALSGRDYQKSQITVEKEVGATGNFKSYIVSYLSDGLKEYALMNVPKTKKPESGFPVVIVNHGFIEPKNYSTINSYKNTTDYFSENGYLVLKPDYRGNGNSEVASKALMRFAYPIDVLNLIESLKNISQANSNQIYLYGHSMGGEVVLKVLEIAGNKPQTSAKIKAAVLWAPVANLSDWFNKSHVPWLQETKNNKNYYLETFKIMKTPEENPILWQSVSPINYLQDIQVPIQINHGLSDGTVAYRTSIELYDRLISLSKTAQLLTYPGNDHNLVQSWNKAAENSLSFFKKY